MFEPKTRAEMIARYKRARFNMRPPSIRPMQPRPIRSLSWNYQASMEWHPPYVTEIVPHTEATELPLICLPKGHAITIAQIVPAVSRVTGVAVNDILSRRRLEHVARARHLCMWMARKLTHYSMPQIGRRLGRDHTSVLHGINKIKGRYHEYSDEVAAIERELRV